jgi:hypothetical protein
MTSSNVLRLVIGDNPVPPIPLNPTDDNESSNGIGGFGVLIAIIVAAATISVPFLIRRKKCDTAFYMSLIPAGIQILAILLGIIAYFAVRNAQ